MNTRIHGDGWLSNGKSFRAIICMREFNIFTQMATTNLLSAAQGEDHCKKTFYDLLGCDKTSSADQIKAEFKLLALKHHPDKSDDGASRAHYLELQRAYDVLSDDQKRAQYDRWLEGGAIVSFDTWMTLQSTHSSFHWGASPQQQPALLEDSSHHNTSASQERDDNSSSEQSPLATFRAGSHSNNDPMLSKFRSYKW